MFQGIFKTSLKTSNCYAEYFFKTSSRYVLKSLQEMPSRCFQDMSWGGLPDVLETNKIFTGKKSISVSSKYKSVSEKSLSKKPIHYKFKTSSRQIMMH